MKKNGFTTKWQFIAIAVSLFANTVSGQDSLTMKLAYIAVKEDRPAIRIGQELPDIGNSKIVNGNFKSIRLSDYKGKIVILDFWHQYCSDCIVLFPHLHKLQNQFKDSIAIIPVTFQSEASVLAFYQKRKHMGKEIVLPSIVEDTLIRKLFPHEGDPHEIWIDKEGIVRAITDSRAINYENIEQLLKGNKIELETKHFQKEFDPSQPLLVNRNGGPDSAFIYRSLLTGYIDSLTNSSLFQFNSQRGVHLFISNSTIVEMYKQWFGANQRALFINPGIDPYNKRVIVETNDSVKFRSWDIMVNASYTAFQSFEKNNVFCYDLVLPSTFSKLSAADFMLNDINRYFNTTAAIKKKLVTCVALVHLTKTDKFKTKNEGLEQVKWEDNQFTMLDKPPGYFADMINYNCPNIPLVINEIKYPGNIDLNLKITSSDDLSTIRHQLQDQGLDLVKKNYLISMLVIHDNRLPDLQKRPAKH